MTSFFGFNFLSSLDNHIEIVSEVADLKAGNWDSLKKINALVRAQLNVSGDICVLPLLDALLNIERKFNKNSQHPDYIGLSNVGIGVIGRASLEYDEHDNTTDYNNNSQKDREESNPSSSNIPGKPDFKSTTTTSVTKADFQSQNMTVGGSSSSNSFGTHKSDKYLYIKYVKETPNYYNEEEIEEEDSFHDLQDALVEIVEILNLLCKVEKYAKIIFSKTFDAKLLLNLLQYPYMHLGADVFSLMIKLNKFRYKQLENTIMQTPLVFQKLMETLQMASPAVRQECLGFLTAILEKSKVLANVIIMQGLFEYLITDMLPNEDQPTSVFRLCEIIMLLLRTSSGGKYFREAELSSQVLRAYEQQFSTQLSQLHTEERENANLEEQKPLLEFDTHARKFKTCEFILDILSLFINNSNIGADVPQGDMIIADEDGRRGISVGRRSGCWSSNNLGNSLLTDNWLPLQNVQALLKVQRFLPLLVETLFLSLKWNYVLAMKIISLIAQLGNVLSKARKEIAISLKGRHPNSVRNLNEDTRRVIKLLDRVSTALAKQLTDEFDFENSIYARSPYNELGEISSDEEDEFTILDPVDKEKDFVRKLKGCPCGGPLIYGLVNLLLLDIVPAGGSSISSTLQGGVNNTVVENIDEENGGLESPSDNIINRRRPNMTPHGGTPGAAHSLLHGDTDTRSPNNTNLDASPWMPRLQEDYFTNFDQDYSELYLFTELRKALDFTIQSLCEGCPILYDNLIHSFIVTEADILSMQDDQQFEEIDDDDHLLLAGGDAVQAVKLAGQQIEDVINTGGAEIQDAFADSLNALLDEVDAEVGDQKPSPGQKQDHQSTFSATKNKVGTISKKVQKKRKARERLKLQRNSRVKWVGPGRLIVKLLNDLENTNLYSSDTIMMDAPQGVRTIEEHFHERIWFALQVMQTILWKAVHKMVILPGEITISDMNSIGGVEIGGGDRRGSNNYASSKSLKNNMNRGGDGDSNPMSKDDPCSPIVGASRIPVQLQISGGNVVMLLDFFIEAFIKFTENRENLFENLFREVNNLFDEKSRYATLTVTQTAQANGGMGGIPGQGDNYPVGTTMFNYEQIFNVYSLHNMDSHNFRRYSPLSTFLGSLEVFIAWSSACPEVQKSIREHSSLIVVRMLDVLKEMLRFEEFHNIEKKGLSIPTMQTRKHVKLVLSGLLTQWMDLCPEILPQCLSLFDGKIAKVHQYLSLVSASGGKFASKKRIFSLLEHLHLQRRLMVNYLGNQSVQNLYRFKFQDDNQKNLNVNFHQSHHDYSGNTSSGDQAHIFILEEYKEFLSNIEEELHVVRQENIRLKSEVATTLEHRNRLQIRGHYSELFREEFLKLGNFRDGKKNSDTGKYGGDTIKRGKKKSIKLAEMRRQFNMGSNYAGASSDEEEEFLNGSPTDGNQQQQMSTKDRLDREEKLQQLRLLKEFTPAFLLESAQENLDLIREENIALAKENMDLGNKVSELKENLEREEQDKKKKTQKLQLLYREMEQDYGVLSQYCNNLLLANQDEVIIDGGSPKITSMMNDGIGIGTQGINQSNLAAGTKLNTPLTTPKQTPKIGASAVQQIGGLLHKHGSANNRAVVSQPSPKLGAVRLGSSLSHTSSTGGLSSLNLTHRLEEMAETQVKYDRLQEDHSDLLELLQKIASQAPELVEQVIQDAGTDSTEKGLAGLLQLGDTQDGGKSNLGDTLNSNLARSNLGDTRDGRGNECSNLGDTFGNTGDTSRNVSRRGSKTEGIRLNSKTEANKALSKAGNSNIT